MNSIAAIVSIAKPRLPKSLIMAASIAISMGVGVVDAVSGYEIDFSLWYTLPVIVIAWQMGNPAGYFISVISSVILVISDFYSGHQYSHFAFMVMNALMELGIFLMLSYFVNRVKNLLDQEARIARTDPLTGAANSRYFYEIAGREMQKSARFQRPISIAYIDMDNFKRLNDTLGHSEGDHLLKEIVGSIAANIRSIDLLARLGGDEFVILLTETGAEQAKTAIEKIRDAAMELIKSRNWPVSMSIGVVTMLCRQPCAIDELIKSADSLMYEVKKAGKNRIIHKSIGC